MFVPSDEFIKRRSPTRPGRKALGGSRFRSLRTGCCFSRTRIPFVVSSRIRRGRDTTPRSRESAHGNSQLKRRVYRVSVRELDEERREREREGARFASIPLHLAFEKASLGIALRHALSHRWSVSHPSARNTRATNGILVPESARSDDKRRCEQRSRP